MKRVTPLLTEFVPFDIIQSSLFSPPPKDVEVSCVKSKYVAEQGSIDPDAVKIINRLNRFGYEAYIVGGSIRDMLFGKCPKDFDIATSALPQEIRRLFGNCRLIGNRFRLAHLLFKNGKVIEVATFRRNATAGDNIGERHASENLFGGAADDAIRRDFTINALMYDVARGEICDYVGGLKDIEGGILRTIGDPERRFQEDPVRIIRAIKFAVRLNLSMEQSLMSAMSKYAPNLKECALPRLVEELLKLLRSGASAMCFESLLTRGVLKELLPRLSQKIEEIPEYSQRWQYLIRADDAISKEKKLSDETILSALVYPFALCVLEDGGDIGTKLDKELKSLLYPLKFNKRHLTRVRQIVLSQRNLIRAPRSQKARRLLERDYAVDALNLRELIVSQADDEILTEWLRAFSKRKKGHSEQKAFKDKRRRYRVK